MSNRKFSTGFPFAMRPLVRTPSTDSLESCHDTPDSPVDQGMMKTKRGRMNNKSPSFENDTNSFQNGTAEAFPPDTFVHRNSMIEDLSKLDMHSPPCQRMGAMAAFRTMAEFEE